MRKRGLKIEVPTGFSCSRVLSIFDEVSCKELMDQDILRIIVRQHLGTLVVTFSGYEGTPWVIQREDPEAVVATEEWSSNPQDYQPVIKSMIIDEAPISIYGGNLKVSWSFAPLLYEEKGIYNFATIHYGKGAGF
jgi:hypothetical protein